MLKFLPIIALVIVAALMGVGCAVRNSSLLSGGPDKTATTVPRRSSASGVVYGYRSVIDRTLDASGELCRVLEVFDKAELTKAVYRFQICEDNVEKFSQDNNELIIRTSGSREWRKNLITGEEKFTDNKKFSGGFSKIK